MNESGKVVDSATGLPITGVLVDCRLGSDDSSLGSTNTDANGQWVLVDQDIDDGDPSVYFHFHDGYGKYNDIDYPSSSDLSVIKMDPINVTKTTLSVTAIVLLLLAVVAAGYYFIFKKK